jgi:ribosomal protein S16
MVSCMYSGTDWVYALLLAAADPLKKETNLNAPAIKKWLTVGAQPSDTVKNLLKKAYVIQPDAIKVDVPRVEL